MRTIPATFILLPLSRFGALRVPTSRRPAMQANPSEFPPAPAVATRLVPEKWPHKTKCGESIPTANPNPTAIFDEDLFFLSAVFDQALENVLGTKRDPDLALREREKIIAVILRLAK